tara:strand:- start:627 stop:827 length:201 start_codon:yes stop_codon:yes gene_type:complete
VFDKRSAFEYRYMSNPVVGVHQHLVATYRSPFSLFSSLPFKLLTIERYRFLLEDRFDRLSYSLLVV